MGREEEEEEEVEKEEEGEEGEGGRAGHNLVWGFAVVMCGVVCELCECGG